MSYGPPPAFFGIPLRTLSLITLAIQNSLLILLMSYSRKELTTPYLASTAVFMNEFIKLLICSVVYFRIKWKEAVLNAEDVSPFGCLKWFGELFRRDSDVLLLSIPAILYTIQNNLQYLAVTYLDAATFQVTYQMKILTTAFFSVLLLGKRLSSVQWTALVFLTFGIILVQFPSSTSSKDQSHSFGSQLIGLIAVFSACCLSGMAGVYFEKILKKPSVTTGSNLVTKPPPSIWERNIQLAFFSCILSLIFGVYIKDYDQVTQKGFFQGYNSLVWSVILAQAIGGLLVAMVVKYADNILKGFATSFSIVISSVISVWLFDFHITSLFLAGSLLVIYSTYLYDCPPAHGKKADHLLLGGYLPIPTRAADDSNKI